MITATQTLSIYEILFKVIKNEADTKILVENIEQVIDNKFDQSKDLLATKNDISTVRQEIRNSEKFLENKMADQFKWLVGIMITLFGLTITIMILLIKK